MRLSRHRSHDALGCVGLALLLAAGLAAAGDIAGQDRQDKTSEDVETWRPVYHFTPPRHFMNDPNGLFHFGGEYHLFYQHNPFGTRWGHMSWGHATSRDLLTWTHHPVAIPEAAGWMIFSGSAAVDSDNRSGLCAAAPCVVAIYTAHRDGRQVQHLAYSGDRGRTWTNYAGNPVLDLGLADFRDPKVAWHAPTRRWVVAVALPRHRQVAFYSSRDLRSWTETGRFGPAGATAGIWECPDLIRVPVERPAGGRGPGERWVLVVSVGSDAPAGGSGVQYFVGEFDGARFTTSQAGPLWADWGPDFYAAQSWNDLRTREPLWIGWMSNWRYANEEPTAAPHAAADVEDRPSAADWARVTREAAPRGPWRGAMSLPRRLAVRETLQGPRLVQIPIETLLARRRGAPVRERVEIEAGPTRGSRPLALRGSALDLDVEIRLGSSTAAGLALRVGGDERTLIRVSRGDAGLDLTLDRADSSRAMTHREFPSAARARLLSPAGSAVRLRVLVDRSSIEVFADGGATVLTSRVFPSPSAERVEAFAEAGSATIALDAHRLVP